MSSGTRVIRARLTWRTATLAAVRAETPTAHTLILDVPGWTRHLAGQHVDVRLTAEDGYSTQRSYSISSAPDGERVEITVQRVGDGEVSPYLVDDLAVGGVIELRGPVGGWFVWRPSEPEPLFLVGGGSGIAPLMAMVRARRAAGSRVPVRVLYAVRSPDEVIFRDELLGPEGPGPGVELTVAYSRLTPPRWARPAQRLSMAEIGDVSWPLSHRPNNFVCGPTGFVEYVADTLVGLGHDAQRIKTERFGPTGG